MLRPVRFTARTARAQRIENAVSRDPAEPAFKGPRTKCRRRLPDRDEDALDDVFCAIGIGQNAIRDAKNEFVMPIVENGKCVRFTAPKSGEKISIIGTSKRPNVGFHSKK